MYKTGEIRKRFQENREIRGINSEKIIKYKKGNRSVAFFKELKILRNLFLGNFQNFKDFSVLLCDYGFPEFRVSGGLDIGRNGF